MISKINSFLPVFGRVINRAEQQAMKDAELEEKDLKKVKDYIRKVNNQTPNVTIDYGLSKNRQRYMYLVIDNKTRKILAQRKNFKDAGEFALNI